MRFVETPVFTSAIQRLLDDERYRRLQLALTLCPARGAVIPGSAGLRKLRWATTGIGKRGGLRVVYYWARDEDAIYLVYASAKSAQRDLTAAQIRTLGALVRKEFT
jgi:mRNA-degrading endonuclease RelE of RelBE toxin-antitoxin system